MTLRYSTGMASTTETTAAPGAFRLPGYPIAVGPFTHVAKERDRMDAPTEPPTSPLLPLVWPCADCGASTLAQAWRQFEGPDESRVTECPNCGRFYDRSRAQLLPEAIPPWYLREL